MTVLRTLGLWWARFAVSAWIGAAVLFVIVGVREVTAEDFSSEIRDRLVVIRFPWFYATGFTLVTSALLATGLARGHQHLSRIARLLAMGLLTLALVGMIADYLAIYRPLERMVVPPGQPRTEQFTTLHRWSTRINSANLLLCAVAAGLLTWPRREKDRETASVS